MIGASIFGALVDISIMMFRKASILTSLLIVQLHGILWSNLTATSVAIGYADTKRYAKAFKGDLLTPKGEKLGECGGKVTII